MIMPEVCLNDWVTRKINVEFGISILESAKLFRINPYEVKDET